MSKCLVTGANGFVGAAVVRRLCEIDRFDVGAAVRRAEGNFPRGVVVHSGLELSTSTDWLPTLSGVDCVVHTAARVHVMKDGGAGALEAYRRINVDGTLALARQSVSAGVRRFVFVSSIKVNGERTLPGRPFYPDDTPAADDPYGISKHEAEVGLRQLAESTDMEVVIIRPPLVYGPGVKANFRTMMRWLGRGIPLPLGAIRNKRSVVALGNLVDLIVTTIEHPAAANQTFLVSDGEDMSTPELLRRMGSALGKSARLLPVPEWVLVSSAAMLGKRPFVRRLCGSLQVDISKTRALLGWSPPVSVDQGLQLVARYFLETECRR